MKLYLTHSSGYDYETQLYAPLKAAFASEHELHLPHESQVDGVNSKEIIPKCDIILAEVSLPSTGQGIELGWADAYNIPIICLYKAGSNPSSSLAFIAKGTVEYGNTEQMISKLRAKIQKFI